MRILSSLGIFQLNFLSWGVSLLSLFWFIQLWFHFYVFSISIFKFQWFKLFFNTCKWFLKRSNWSSVVLLQFSSVSWLFCTYMGGPRENFRRLKIFVIQYLLVANLHCHYLQFSTDFQILIFLPKQAILVEVKENFSGFKYRFHCSWTLSCVIKVKRNFFNWGYFFIVQQGFLI